MPLVPLAVAFASGIAIAGGEAAAAWVVWLVALAATAVLVIAGRPGLGAPLLLAGAAALGAIRASPAPLPLDHVARLALPRQVQLDARLLFEPARLAPDRWRLVVETEAVDKAPRSGRVQLTLYGEPPVLAEGQRLSAPLRLHHARGFQNPGGFDYAAHLAREGILVVASVSAERVEALEAPAPRWAARVRRWAKDAVAQALPPASAALLHGLLLGARGDLPGEIDEAFRRAGVYHVLAVSGFNVALLASAVFALLKLARAGPRISPIVAIVLVVGFALVVGPEPSVARATIMAVLVLVALVIDREASVTNSLALAALIILAARPGDLRDPGFQLSFAATAGILAAPLPRSRVLAAFGVTLAAQLAVLPVMLAHFNQLSTIAPLANLAVTPLAGAATVLGLLAVAVSAVTATGGQILFDAVWPLLLALRGAVALAAAMPGALVHLPAPHAAAITAHVAGLGLALGWWHLRGDRPRAGRVAGVAAAALLAAGALGEAWPLLRPASGRLRVTILDVGQGDAIVVEAPDGRALLVDAGPGGPDRLDAGARVVAPYLWNRGHLRLAAAVTTDQDVDHAGGMASITRLFAIGETWRAADFQDGPRLLGGVQVSALPGSIDDTSNDGTLVLRLDFGHAVCLLASDAGRARERDLLAAGVPLSATVLKVAHHGSRQSTSEDFLAAVAPAVAVVSAGARNPYGHPHPDTLDRLRRAGAHTYRTDRDGAIILETDGRTLDVRAWATGRSERVCLDPDTPC